MNVILLRHRGPALSARPFTLTVDLDAPRLILSRREVQSNGRSADAHRLLTLGGNRAEAFLPPVLELLHKAGYSVAHIQEQRRRRMRLLEPVGARLALLLWALAPIQKPSRATLIRTGLLSMSDEELYYWYSKCESNFNDLARQTRERTLKALRILLAGE